MFARPSSRYARSTRPVACSTGRWWVDGDDFTDKAKAVETAQRLINQEGVQVIIGAGASSITKAVLPTVLGAGVVLFSPCNTAAELDTVDDRASTSGPRPRTTCRPRR